MTGEEIGSYLHHHLNLASRSDTLFSDDATVLITRRSGCLPSAGH
jgi:type II secretory pathway predicted ATPase ExeA